MIKRLLIAGASLALAAVAINVAAQPRPAAEPVTVGATVYDAAGAPLGRIESLITDAEGRPQQALIRAAGGSAVRSRLKSLPLSSLKPRPEGYAVSLRKSEFDLLPAVERP